MLSSLLALSILSRPVDGIDAALAQRYFQEAKWVCEDDASKLWGKPLWGALLFVDPGTRQVAASEVGPGLTEKSGVFVGSLPKTIGIANTSFEWEGKRWTMVMWPLPANRGERVRLVTHELFHRLQPELGFTASSPTNAQMDTEKGRLWLQLEGKALSAALMAAPEESSKSIEDALVFRAKRQSLFPAAKSEEDALELNEGLAEYTGYKMKGTYESEARSWLGTQIRANFMARPSYSRSFAYVTGSAYGYLLDLEESLRKKQPSWRTGLKQGDSLTDILAKTMSLSARVEEAESRAQKYGYDALAKQEADREKKRLETERGYSAKLVDGPVLELSFAGANFSYNPNDVFPFGARGTVYPTCTVIAPWGTLKGEKGVLINSDYSKVFVSAPKSATELSGDGWTLELAKGWKLVPGSRAGDFVVVKE